MARAVPHRFHPLITLVALLSLVLVPQAGAQQGPLAPWLEARAREHAEWAEDSTRVRSGPMGLWREWAAKEPMLPGFVPPTSLAPLIRAVESGVVNINVVGTSPLEGAARTASGSGFILTPDGLVVTNNHVVARGNVEASEIVVRLSDGREFRAEVVGRDKSTDVALLRLLGQGVGGLPAVYLGDSDRLEVGDWVVAIGNPFGLDHSVSHGMISAKERVIGVGPFDDFIQTDALINPGNSGGPLFNMRGEVVGVNTAIISEGQGIGFAVPINMVKDLLPNLRKNGQLQRGWLGVMIDEQPQVGTRAAVVKEVYRNSPAAQAGIRPGDQVVGVNGKQVDSYQQLLRKVAMLAPGTEARLTLQRGGAPQDVVVKLAARPAQEALAALSSPGNLEEFGLVLRDLTPEVAAPLGVEPYTGVLVSGVLPRSAAARAGLRTGDMVVEVNRRKVKDIAAVKGALERGAGASVLLRVQRGDAQQYVALEP
ncbi:trypsin-like peptidase domain-containing protein [Vitiosangium sp. GDMCC 1.1324]|uniref:trypsin-like peptidase domain-containing protein n=1 Tax=Vitiosangium sp. (strain GDMCC 1.1324) TaxID=2138576 RepID=UPI000D34E6BA|nr:trypsin-like peptidase domain-containing protein [Vitiosangium sp. GDMCC 1.1324]PTL75669.1 serine protease [Vitiosangium sp. GDMCC 1.1324]